MSVFLALLVDHPGEAIVLGFVLEVVYKELQLSFTVCPRGLLVKMLIWSNKDG